MPDRMLACYLGPDGRPRELLARTGRGGSVLVVDRNLGFPADHRLLAHLAPDEPLANATLVCRDYLLVRPRRGGCRQLTPADLRAPLAEGQSSAIELTRSVAALPGVDPAGLVDRAGRTHQLRAFASGHAIPQLRWLRRAGSSDAAVAVPVSLREVVAALQSYEPARGLTAAALEREHDNPEVSITTLRAELERLDASAIVLNRGLREAVLRAVRTQSLSMSEVAMRCGRVKRDRRGRISGETSWLARRIGLMPEGGARTPTPWVHSEVLGLIAREGLGISPREVELG